MKILFRSAILIITIALLFREKPVRADEGHIGLDIQWGAATNGINAGVGVMHDIHQWHKNVFSPIEIIVYIKGSGFSTLVGPGKTPLFWGPTNFFCGPIKLEDANSNTITQLKPDVSYSTAYPKSLNVRQINEDYWRWLRKLGAWTVIPPIPGDLGPAFLSDFKGGHLQSVFYLNDYFEIKGPGEYKFTVSAKLYKQSETNSDVYQRIDIPPVTVPIQWP